MRLDLDGLAAASREALMSEWREVVGRPPPKHLSRPLMVQICPSSYKMGHQSGLSFGGSGSSVWLIMQPAFDVASGDIGLSVS